MGEREDFVVAQQVPLTRAAYLLTGQDQATQDLVQETLILVLMRWRQVARAASPQAYVQRMMVNAFLSGHRRSWVREHSSAEPPERASVAGFGEVEDRDELSRALLALPDRQRAAVVLRHYSDLSEAQTAEALNCSVGNVKALTSRGLAALRTAMDGARHDGSTR